MKARKQQMDNEMKNILSPDQFEKWQASRKAKIEERKAMMKDRAVNGERKMMKKPHPDASM